MMREDAASAVLRSAASPSNGTGSGGGPGARVVICVRVPGPSTQAWSVA